VELLWTLEGLTAADILDILLVALIFFALTFFIRGTQAVSLLRGMLIVLGVIIIVSNVFSLSALQWLLTNALTVLAVAIPVVFQPELRRLLDRLGRGGLFASRQPRESQQTEIIEQLAQAAEKLSDRRHGALVVLQRNTSLDEYVRTGVALHAEVTAQLLLTIFWPKTELHDGAVIIDNTGRAAAAGCVLPLTSVRSVDQPKLGTRHRAALGMSEVSDAVCVIVSEETGRISIAHGGRLIMRLDGKRLRTILNALYGPERIGNLSLRQRLAEGLSLLTVRPQQPK
jgi:diadenylate cyclase